MDKPHDAQVEAFIAKARKYASIEKCNGGEFIIDGVVNVRAALDAAMAVERDGSATSTSGGDHD